MARGKRRKPTKAEIDAAADRAEGKTPDDDAREYDPLEPEEVVVKVGRPTTFDPAILPKLQECAEAGLTDHQIRQVFEIPHTTWYRWLADHKEFRQALRLGKLEADRMVERSMHHRAIGYSYDAVKILQNNGEPLIVPYVEHIPPDVGAQKFWLTNRQKKRWKDKTSQEITGKDGGPIQVDDVTDLEKARRIAFYLREASEKIKGQRT